MSRRSHSKRHGDGYKVITKKKKRRSYVAERNAKLKAKGKRS